MKILVAVATLLVSLAIFIPAAEAQVHTIWHSPLTAVTDDPANVQLWYGSPSQSLKIYGLTTGLHTVYVPVTLPSDVTVEKLVICYQCETSFTYIEEINLVEVNAPGTIVARLTDGTNLDSTLPLCYSTSVATVPPNYSPNGTLAVELVLNFASTTEFIALGGIGVDVAPVP